MKVQIHRTPQDQVHVSAGYGVSIGPDEADAVARQLTDIAQQIRQDAARAVCAVEGHQWWGYNAYTSWPEGKVHLRYCERDACGLEERLDGWRDTVYPPAADTCATKETT